MKTLTVNEAARDLAGILRQAIAGEEIGIRSDGTIVALHPVPALEKSGPEMPLPREALRRLQQDARLTDEQAEEYLKEVRAERLAAEDRGKG